MATEFMIGGATSTASSTSTSTSTSKTDSTTAASQDRFLKLLVAQLKNQDPLNPADNAQMTSQMAQISTVDGISKLNDTMTSMLAQVGASQQLNATSLIGHSVLVDGSRIGLSTATDGSRVAGAGFELDASASSVKVGIYDSGNALVNTLDLGTLPSGTQTFSWDGKTSTGAAAADGNYSFKVVASNSATGSSSAVNATALSVGRVDGIKRTTATDGSVTTLLDLGGLGYHSQTDVRSVY